MFDNFLSADQDAIQNDAMTAVQEAGPNPLELLAVLRMAAMGITEAGLVFLFGMLIKATPEGAMALLDLLEDAQRENPELNLIAQD